MAGRCCINAGFSSDTRAAGLLRNCKWICRYLLSHADRRWPTKRTTDKLRPGVLLLQGNCSFGPCRQHTRRPVGRHPWRLSVNLFSTSRAPRPFDGTPPTVSGKHVSLDATANSQGGNYVDGNTRVRRSLARCDYNSCNRRRRQRRFTKPRIKSGAANFLPQKRYAQQTTICFCDNETAIKTTWWALFNEVSSRCPRVRYTVLQYQLLRMLPFMLDTDTHDSLI